MPAEIYIKQNLMSKGVAFSKEKTAFLFYVTENRTDYARIFFVF